MKRAVKSELTKEKIITAALNEFGTNGYEAASLNAVCEKHKISKGLIYHNFHSKDDIYLICVGRVFNELTNYIKEYLVKEEFDFKEDIKGYLLARSAFFADNPLFLKIFCEAVVFPPAHLEDKIREVKKEFDNHNIHLIKELTADLKLRLDFSEQKMIDTFCRSFDLIDVVSQIKRVRKKEIQPLTKEEFLALDILLYGLIER